jgi:hypothetical protein
MRHEPKGVPFGQYRGMPLEDIPSTYLYWLHEILGHSGPWDDLRKVMKDDRPRAELYDLVVDELEARRINDVVADPSTLSRRDRVWLGRLIQAGYRALSRQNHPDQGGDTKAMQELNGAMERIRALLKGGSNADRHQ